MQENKRLSLKIFEIRKNSLNLPLIQNISEEHRLSYGIVTKLEHKNEVLDLYCKSKLKKERNRLKLYTSIQFEDQNEEKEI